MSLSVLKFGGTSLGTLDRINNAANIIKEQIELGNQIVVVVSAMEGATNKILEMCRDLSSGIDMSVNLEMRKMQDFEVDVALSTGETLSASLLAISLLKIGINARSFQAWQIGINSNNHPNSALISSVDSSLIKNILSDTVVPIITGFQALSDEGRITTIGRGGSDTSAAIIAASIKADFCDIYTDVEGLYTSDPNLIFDARIIKELTYLETIELARGGAKVLHPTSVENCMRYGIILRIFSTFNKKCGTVITSQVNEINKTIGISHLKKMTLLKVFGLKNQLNDAINIFLENGVNIQNILNYENDKVTLCILDEYAAKLAQILESRKFKYEIRQNIGSIVVVGSAIRHDISILKEILKIFETNNVEILGLVNNEIKVCVFCEDKEVEKLVQILHDRFIKDDE